MSRKKPSPAPIPVPGTNTQNSPGHPPRRFPGSTQNPRLQPDNRWQRTKRYGWNSR